MKISLKQLLVSCALFTLGASQIQAISVIQYVQQSGVPRIGNTLDFSNTGLTTLDGLAEILQNSPRVRSLNVSNNRITQIPAHIFDNAPQLQDLDLSNNQISRLPQNIFAQLINLRNLNLTNNPLAPDFISTFIAMIHSIPNLQTLNGQPVEQAIIRLQNPPRLRELATAFAMQNLQPEQLEELAETQNPVFNILPLTQAQRQAIQNTIAERQAAQQQAPQQ